MDVPVVVPSAALVSNSAVTITEDVDVCDESENDVGIPVAASSAELVSVSEETSMDVDVCERSVIEVDISVVANLDSLQTHHGKDAVPSEPIKSLTDAESRDVMRLPEVGLGDYAVCVRVGSESDTNLGGLGAKRMMTLNVVEKGKKCS